MSRRRRTKERGDAWRAVSGQCASGKFRYASELAARAVLARVQARAEDNPEKRQEYRTYLCGRCNGWHLTSMPLGDFAPRLFPGLPRP